MIWNIFIDSNTQITLPHLYSILIVYLMHFFYNIILFTFKASFLLQDTYFAEIDISESKQKAKLSSAAGIPKQMGDDIAYWHLLQPVPSL